MLRQPRIPRNPQARISFLQHLQTLGIKDVEHVIDREPARFGRDHQILDRLALVRLFQVIHLLKNPRLESLVLSGRPFRKHLAGVAD